MVSLIGNSSKNNSSSKRIIEIAQKDIGEVLSQFGTSMQGLSPSQANERLKEHGLNEITREQKLNPILLFLKTFKEPLIILLLVLGIISFITGDVNASVVIISIVLVSISLRFFQEYKANTAAQKLKAMVKTTATVIRNGKKREVAINFLVPGDVIHLSAGDMVPAEARIISSKDLFVNQATLTGESLPVEKHAMKAIETSNPAEMQNMCFMGTNIESGTAEAVVVFTGKNTYLGSLSRAVSQNVVTSFDKGIKSFTWLMIRFILVAVPLVFLINALTKSSWLEAFLFSIAIAIGLTPEMLPMIVTVNLSKGAIVMAQKKVIVKRLNSIQNFGAMDVLCTDKTGTITQGKVILEKYIDLFGNEENDEVLKCTYLNSYYETGLKNILDKAILGKVDLRSVLNIDKNYKKVDEVTFDFMRKRMSVVVEEQKKTNILICKGAVDEVMGVCTRFKSQSQISALEKSHHAKGKKIINKLNSDGFRVIAVAYKETPKEQLVYTVNDESDMILLGFVAFLDPPKETALEAITSLRNNGVAVKILTGDNDIVTKKVCKDVGLPVMGVMLGSEMENLSDEKLAEAVEGITIFAKLLPYHKEMIIKALQRNGHVVGFLGDGINDTSALKVSDVGISVDKAVDVAKESSDIILLRKSLNVLGDGVIEGRKVFGNIVKYLKMAASSNFGNVLSVLGSSVFLPFLPMLPIQILINNMLYDFSQITIPTDHVDEEYLAKPRKWKIDEIQKYILIFGPISSIFDYLTFFVLIYIFNASSNPELFHTGWFVESLITQTLIIHVIRTNKVPFLQSRSSMPLFVTTLVVAIIGIYLPYSPFSKALGFVPLPPIYFLFLLLFLVLYISLTQLVKNRIISRHL